MSKRKDGQARSKYTLEFKLEAVRLVKGGQAGDGQDTGRERRVFLAAFPSQMEAPSSILWDGDAAVA